MIKKAKKYLIISLSFILLMIIIRVSATSDFVTIIDSDYASIEVIDNGDQAGKREIQLAFNDIAAGKKLDKINYCLKTSDCNDDNNWYDVANYDESNIVSSFANSVGSAEMNIFLRMPLDELYLRVDFVDFEPMNISYAKYNLETTNESEYRDIYGDKITDINNYDDEFTTIVTGFKGGDVILPSGCTQNGCLLKVTFQEEDYNAIVSRLDFYNEHYNEDYEDKRFLDLASMFNHLNGENLTADTIMYLEKNNELYIETEGNTKSFYLIVNKFFYQTNRSEFIVGDNKNRILSEDYIGLKYTVDRKYFDEGNNYGFLTFNEFNDYTAEATIFYGTPIIKFDVDRIIEPVLTATGDASGMGVVKHQYNKIVSANPEKYPINNNFELTINSFYEPDYVVPIILKDNDIEVYSINY